MPRLRKLTTLVAAVLAAVTAVSAAHPGLAAASTSGPPPLPSSASSPEYGVLIANPVYALSDHDAGLRLAIVSVNWRQWEPSAGAFNAVYQAQEVSIIDTYRSDGFTVGINPSLNNAPTWVTAAAGSTLVDQNGNSSGSPNFEFSAAVRSATATYLTNLVATLGAASYFEIGYSTNAELQYPAASKGQWWAFDANAQGTATGGLPSGVGVTPMPGWVPGTTTWKGVAVTTAQVQSWYTWYLGADINFAKFEMNTVTSAGFGGYFQLKMPGDGANPWVYPHRIAADLAPETYDSYHTLNIGEVWQNVIPALAGPNVVVDVTSVGDESGSPADNPCQTTDSSVNWTTNSTVDSWSSTRWLSYLAAKSGLPVIGESTGNNSATTMTHDLSLVHACGLIGLQWGFDQQLYSGSYATVANYAADLGVSTSPSVGLSMQSFTFLARPVGSTSAPLNVAVQNTGAAPLKIASVAVGNPAFSITGDSCNGQTIAAAATCTVSVDITPLAWGPVSSALTITDNAVNSPQAVSLSGYGNGPTVGLDPANVGFGVNLPGTTSAAKTVQINNTGQSPLHVGPVIASGTGFAVSSNTCTGSAVAPGGSCSLGVTFDPAGVNFYTGSLQFTSDANNSPTTIGLSGTGGAPVVGFSPSSYTFGSTLVGITSPAQTLLVKNTGNEPLHVTSATSAGIPFAVASTTCTNATVNPGGSCQVRATFKPTTATTVTGGIQVVDSLGTQTIHLTGTGHS